MTTTVSPFPAKKQKMSKDETDVHHSADLKASNADRILYFSKTIIDVIIPSLFDVKGPGIQLLELDWICAMSDVFFPLIHHAWYFVEKNLENTDSQFYTVLKSGSVRLAQLVRDKNCCYEKFEKIVNKAFRMNFKHPCLKMIKWIDDNFSEDLDQVDFFTTTQYLPLIHAIEHSRIDIISWLFETNLLNKSDINTSLLTKVIHAISKISDITIHEWLYNIFGTIINFYHPLKILLFTKTIEQGRNIKVAEWIREKYSVKLSYDDLISLMKELASKSDTIMAQYVFDDFIREQYTTIGNENNFYMSSFKIAAYSNHIGFLKWLDDTFKDCKFNTKCLNALLTKVCKSNALLSLQYLHSKYDIPYEVVCVGIDSKSSLLKTACESSRINIMLWLCETYHLTKKDLASIKYDILTRCLYLQNMDVVEWLINKFRITKKTLYDYPKAKETYTTMGNRSIDSKTRHHEVSLFYKQIQF